MRLAPVSYEGAGVILYTCLVYVAFQGWFAPDGPLRFATRPTAVRLGRLLGDATLGVFALHVTVLMVLRWLGWLGGPHQPSETTAGMVARVAVVLLVTYAIVLPLRRIPYVRAVV